MEARQTETNQTSASETTTMEQTYEISIESHLLDLIAEWKTDLFDLNFKDIDGWSDSNRELAASQYAYIKFGLILEKNRESNRSTLRTKTILKTTKAASRSCQNSGKSKGNDSRGISR